MTVKEQKDICILIVDDEPDFRDVLMFSFKRVGYQVLCASSGREAFELIKSKAVDVVVSDIRMPGGDGVELLDRAKALRPETPIILLVTGYADLTLEEAHNKGAEAIFSKPFDWRVLEETIKNLLTPAEERWRRSAEKVDTELNVHLSFPGFGDAIDARMLSIGRGGMFVTIRDGHFPNVRETVAFKIGFEDGGSFEGTGVVSWIRPRGVAGFPSGCGIEFIYFAESERQRVIELVKTRRPRPFIPNQ